MSTTTKEVTGRPVDVARAFLHSVIEQMGDGAPPTGLALLEEILLEPVMVAMALAVEGNIPFAATANAPASVLAHAADMDLRMSSRKEGLQ